MRYLLDTNVLSEARKHRPESKVVAWLESCPSDDQAISVITAMELKVGVLRKARKNPLAGAYLERWFHAVMEAFDGRVLPVDLATAWRIAPLYVPDPAPEHDAIIAGTALTHGLTVVTRNDRDFTRMGVPVLNPWL
ncbi:MAG: type II toxin-antitoxin system VapC family toxin [Bifidobacteriaceae bacterium]|jgi:predicted nucleic acid-binding protein|nr:type II toxin-antitoxin system VapC family toxin [Bifidobacteriaceae bacterium]